MHGYVNHLSFSNCFDQAITMSDFHDLVSDEPISAGVFMRRYPDGVETNIPHRVTHHSPTGYEWGYGGSGPADLALNVLEAALTILGHTGRRMECWRGGCYHLAWLLHQDAKRELIAPIPIEGGVIYWPALHGWITERVQKQGICLTCGEPLDLDLSPDDYGQTERDGSICPACGKWRPSSTR